MQSIPFGVDAIDFRWCVGIEDTFIPQTRSGLRALDEYELMGHYEQWREHLRLAGATGARMIRWGIPWYRVEPHPGVFDWSWTDQVIRFMVDELGIEPILDLMHYGTPLWMERSFVDPRYPDAVAAYARAVAERYGDRVRYYTPLNEPIVNALFCGMRGLWPPYLRGERGFLRVGIALAQGIVKTVQALKAIDPGFVMVHVEAAGRTLAARAELEPIASEYRHRSFLFFDLITGRVTADHPLFRWLLFNGVSYRDLEDLAGQAISIDVMGLNFYPQWSTQQVELDAGGRLRLRVAEKQGQGFQEMLAGYYERYGVPMMITETSARGTLDIKRRWLDASVSAVRALRQTGIPVIGYTWFPLFTMIDWRYRTGRKPKEAYLLELGLYESARGEHGELRLVPSEMVERFRALTEHPMTAVGDLRIGRATPAPEQAGVS